MKTLERNKRTFWYCTVKSENGVAETREIIDEHGNGTGQYIVLYNDPVEMKANVSPATGQSNTEQFGNLENYDKVIVTDDLKCPIDENSVLFIDKEPEFTGVITYSPTAITTEEETVSVPAFDYIVRRVAKSLNSVSIAVRKVNVS